MSKATFTRAGKLSIAISVLLSSGLVLAVGGILIYLAFRPEVRERFDLTKRQEFTLDDKTLKILENLDQDVHIYACFRPQNFTQSAQYVRGLEAALTVVQSFVHGLIKEYELRGEGRVSAHLYDPQVSGHVARIVELSTKLGEVASNLVVVEAGERRIVLRVEDLADYEQKDGFARLRNFTAQQAISSAMLAVTEVEPIKVAWVIGHGERDPEARSLSATGLGGYSKVLRDLITQNFVIQKVDLSQVAISPAAVDLLVLAAPTKELPTEEMEAVVDFVNGGGRLLSLWERDTPIAVDYPLLDQLLGLKRRDGVVNIAAENAISVRRSHLFNEVVLASSHPITKPLVDKELRTYWDGAVGFSSLGRPEHSDLIQSPLARTEDRVKAWLDLPGPPSEGQPGGGYNGKYDPATEERGLPINLAYSVEFPKEKGGGRVVVVGDAHIFDDVNIDKLPGNRPLIMNIAEWLAGREELIALPAKKYDELRVDLTAKEYETIFLYVVILIPCGALLAAFAVFWMRRQ